MNIDGEETITDDLIKSASGEYDVEVVAHLPLCGLGIGRMENLDRCMHLVELNLSDNCISVIDGLKNCKSLRKLVLTSNKVTAINADVYFPPSLQHVLLQDNRISNMTSFLPFLSKAIYLKSFYLQNLDGTLKNPVCRVRAYRKSVLSECGHLVNLDGRRVVAGEADDEQIPTVSDTSKQSLIESLRLPREHGHWIDTNSSTEPLPLSDTDPRVIEAKGISQECRRLEGSAKTSIEHHINKSSKI